MFILVIRWLVPIGEIRRADKQLYTFSIGKPDKESVAATILLSEDIVPSPLQEITASLSILTFGSVSKEFLALNTVQINFIAYYLWTQIQSNPFLESLSCTTSFTMLVLSVNLLACTRKPSIHVRIIDNFHDCMKYGFPGAPVRLLLQERFSSKCRQNRFFQLLEANFIKCYSMT